VVINRVVDQGVVSMELNTAASVISYASKIEQESTAFYEQWAKRYEALREVALSFVRENKKNEANIKRAYYSVVTDALETNFCFKGLIGDVAMPLISNDASFFQVLEASLVLENSMQKFYLKAAELSKALLADVTRAMERVAKTREARVAKLRSMVEGMEG
jgi:hypothetical protein